MWGWVALRPLKKTPQQKVHKISEPEEIAPSIQVNLVMSPTPKHSHANLTRFRLSYFHGFAACSRLTLFSTQQPAISHFSFLICPSLRKIITIEFIKTTKERKRKAKAHHPHPGEAKKPKRYKSTKIKSLFGSLSKQRTQSISINFA